MPKPNKRKRLIHNARVVKKMKTSSEPLLLIEQENNVPIPLDFEITKEKLTAIRMKRQKETPLSTDLEEAAKKLAQSFLIPRRN